MGGYNDLKTAIAALIRTNDNQEITGATLQSALLSIINTIGQGSVFKGVATTSTNPGSPDANVFYIAGRPGYYPNFNLELTAGLHVIENKSGAWVNTEIALDVIDAINIGGAKHVKPSQAMIIALQSVEQIPDSEGRNNAMWWSTDGNLKYKQSDTVYNLGAPAYVLYYCGDKIYKWTGSGFREIGGGGTFASGEAVSNMSIFDDGSDTDGKSSTQLAAMIPSGAVIRSLLDLISTIDTSGGAYDGSDLITTFSYDEPTRTITVKQQNRQAKTIILPIATSTKAGLMSSEDKTQLANIQNLIGKTVNSFSKSTGETGITITLVTSNGTPHAVLIPIDSELSSQSTSNLVTGAAIYNFLMTGFVYLDQDNRAFAPYTRILPLVSMGSALDNGNTPTQINANEFRYDPTTKRIYRHNNNVQPYFMPGASQLYLNICTGKMYKWTGSDMEEISGGVDPTTLAGKADKHAAADILTPSQWPRVMLYNIESMWGAGGTPPDYASIPVGSIYLDDSDGVDDPPYRRLFYKKTLEGTSQRIDLGAPQENTIYCHIATGKLYRWIPTQNGNDGAFQQIGGSGTVTGVSVNNGQVNIPDQNGVINLDIQIPQSGLQQSDISLETQGDGVVNFNVGTDTYSLDLRHNHAGMAKLEKCVELPSELQDDTIYVQVDNLTTPTEIQSIYLFGLEFVGGGGTPSTDPRILSPIGTQIDFNGESTKTVTVRATNLSEALTIAVTGITASLQTISANDAENGVQLTLTKGQNFNTGTLRIYSSEVDKSWNVGDSQSYQLLTAIKLTGTQWLKTNYVPKTTTEFEMLVKFGDRNTNNTFGAVLTTNVKPAESGDPYLFRMNTDVATASDTSMGLFFGNAKSQLGTYGLQGFQSLTEQQMLSDNTLISYTLGTDTNNNPCGIFRFGSLTHFTSLQAVDMDSPIMIGYGRTTNSGADNIFNRYSLTIYRFTITEGGVTVRNYVPARYNGVPGLYDTITSAFISSETLTPVVAIE